MSVLLELIIHVYNTYVVMSLILLCLVAQLTHYRESRSIFDVLKLIWRYDIVLCIAICCVLHTKLRTYALYLKLTFHNNLHHIFHSFTGEIINTKV